MLMIGVSLLAEAIVELERKQSPAATLMILQLASVSQ
jgi:hypothetical protein